LRKTHCSRNKHYRYSFADLIFFYFVIMKILIEQTTRKIWNSQIFRISKRLKIPKPHKLHSSKILYNDFHFRIHEFEYSGILELSHKLRLKCKKIRIRIKSKIIYRCNNNRCRWLIQKILATKNLVIRYNFQFLT